MNDTPVDDAHDSLELQPTTPLASPDKPSIYAIDAPPPQQHKRPWKVILLTAIALGAIIVISALAAGWIPNPLRKKTSVTKVVINTQTLDNGTLNKLVQQTAPNQPASQQLTISPDTLFKNSVVVNKTLIVGGATTLQSATSINGNLAVRGDASIGGIITAGSLNVGALNVTNVTASGNLTFNGHFIPGGSAPSAKPSVAAGGGTVSISGNDTSGTITITTGTGVTAGELAIITFKTGFATTPKVQLTPINASSAALRYYATRSAGFFTVETATTPPAGTTFVFDYSVSQ